MSKVAHVTIEVPDVDEFNEAEKIAEEIGRTLKELTLYFPYERSYEPIVIHYGIIDKDGLRW